MKCKFPDLLAAVACAALVTLGGSLASAAVIDNFDDGSGTVLAGPGGSASDTEAGLAGVLGGVRRMDIPGTSGPLVSGTGNLTVAANPASSGFLSFSLDATTDGSVVLTYDGGGLGLGVGGADLTDGGMSGVFTFEILTIDQGNVTLIVTVTDSDSTASVTVTGADVGITQFSFMSFSGIDFTNVNAVYLEIAGVDGSDLTLGVFETSGPSSSSNVPEPSTLAMFGVGGVLAGLYRWRRKRVS